MKRMNVKLVCTTDDPIDSLEYHKQIVSAFCTGISEYEHKNDPKQRTDKGKRCVPLKFNNYMPAFVL